MGSVSLEVSLLFPFTNTEHFSVIQASCSFKNVTFFCFALTSLIYLISSERRQLFCIDKSIVHYLLNTKWQID